MKFDCTHCDYERSPYTGMTRESWIDAAKFLLQSAFTNVHSTSDTLTVPRSETKVTYPHAHTDKVTHAIECMAQRFEGLARSFFIAAPLIHNDPTTAINGINLRDYYKTHVLRACTPTDENYAGSYTYLQNMTKHADPTRCFQQTVETCALVICLWLTETEIWNTYTQAEQDTIAAFLSDHAHNRTVPQNWRLFNMLDLAFLHKKGYSIDADIIRDHAMSILAYYAGDGWYRDGHTFDYYSCWAFQFYAPLWNVWYGYEHLPHIAAQFEHHSHELMQTYPCFFDRDGWTNMWGRSGIYRFASVSAFDGNMLLPNPSVDYGHIRRICSGSLLQFMTREDFWENGVPSLGFYRRFPPLVQGYSCAESVFWMGKAFLCLHFPADHPFWTQKETNGFWDTLRLKEIKSCVLDGPALAVTDHEANGTAYLRTGKCIKDKNDTHGIHNYGKLCYATKYPWESSPHIGIESQQYMLQEKGGAWQTANATLWCGESDGVLYRRQFFDYDTSRDYTWTQAVNLADFAVPYGILRADKLRLFRRPVTVTLGSFGFPDNGTQIIRKERDNARAVILKGYDACGRPKQLALSVLYGWDTIDVMESTDTNPDSERSLIPYAVTRRNKEYGYENYLLISQTLTKESHEDFTDDELFPLVAVHSDDEKNYGAYGKIVLDLTDGTKKVLCFDGIEGKLSI